jgi:alkaline phosphatase
MKKFFISLGLLLAAATLFAQEPILGAVSKEVSGNEAVVSNITKHGSYTPSFKCDGTNGKVRNVILMIGDGMGNGHVASAFYANGGELTMTNLRSMGYVCTQSADSFTTDSAASGTAYATGSKTNNRYLGVGPDGKRLKNIPETVVPRGYAAGVVSTDDVHGATPAAFFAHQPNRKMVAEIWGDIPSSYLSFLSAGDRKVYNKQDEATRKAIEEKFKVVYEPGNYDDDKVLYLPPTVKVGERGNYLPETTQMAIDFLSKKSKKGFFLMVEGARIDKEAHGNRLDGVVGETLDFDKAIEVAIRFAEKDGHTLVVISADHETGGMTLKSGQPEPGTVAAVFSSKGHTPCFVPLFAYGPHSRDFACIQQNNDVANKIKGLLK